jgi:uncharacterized membrane protein YidH (DUF202 family)
MSGFKFKPVAWMTTILALLSGAVALDDTLEATGTADLIPAAVEPYAQGAIVALTVILGRMAYNRVTPLAAPKTAEGEPAVLLRK